MKCKIIETYSQYNLWHNIGSTGLVIEWEWGDRTGTCTISSDMDLEIDTESKLNKEMFLELMSVLYDKAEVK